MTITQPSVLAYGAATGTGTSRTTASFAAAANRVLVFMTFSTSGTPFPAEPPTLSGAIATAFSWNYETRGHENSTYPRNGWMWSAYSGSGATGTLTWTTTNSMSANALYAVVQFAEGEVDLTDPIVRPTGNFPDLPPDNGAQVYAMHHRIAEFADPSNGVLHFVGIGAANPASLTHDGTGFTRLAYQQSGSSWAALTEWKATQAYDCNPTWPQAEGGLIAHYVSLACEIRAAGTDNSVGRIHDRSLESGGSSTDGTVFTTEAFTTFRDRDVWLAVASARTAATPSQPVITSTLGWTWSLVEQVAYNTIASPTQKLWLFHARVGTSNPGANTVTITYPQTQTACAWQISETQFNPDTSPVVQAKAARIDSSTTAFSATFDTALDPTSSTMFFLAKADNDQSGGNDTLTGTVEQGWVQHEQAEFSTPSLSVSGFARHTPDTTPSITLRQNADVGMIAIELAFSGASSVTTIDVDPISVTPQLFTPKAQPSVSTTLIDVTPSIFTPQPSTTSFAQTVRFGLGAFQQTAFDDTAFNIGTTQLTSHIPTLFAPSSIAATGPTFVYIPAPGDTIAAFQQDAFDDETFQQDATGEGIAHIPSLNAPTVAATVAAAQFVYLTGTGGWDSTLFVWDDPGHVWDEGNIDGLIPHAPQLFAPTVLGRIEVPLLDATPTLYIHSVAPKSITAPLISHPPALFDHKVNMLVLQTDIIDMPVVLFGFFIQAPVEPDLIDHSPELFTPTVNPQTVEMDLISHEPAVFNHKVNMSVLPDLLDATPTLYAPAVGPVITPDLIDAIPVVYIPSLEWISVDLIDIGVELFEPQKVNIPVNTVVNFEFIALPDYTPELFEPVSIELAPPQFIVGQFIDGTPLVMGPHIVLPTRPTIILRARYDPVTVLKARYDPVTTKHAQNARQGA